MKLTNAAMLDILEVVRSEECGDTVLAPLTIIENCRQGHQWRGDFSLVFTDRNVQDFNFNFPPTLLPRTEEYVHLKDLSEGLGDIQRELYHKPSDQTLLETVLGLINTSKKLEDRLRILFEAGYKCPAEIEFIKSSIM